MRFLLESTLYSAISGGVFHRHIGFLISEGWWSIFITLCNGRKGSLNQWKEVFMKFLASSMALFQIFGVLLSDLFQHSSLNQVWYYNWSWSYLQSISFSDLRKEREVKRWRSSELVWWGWGPLIFKGALYNVCHDCYFLKLFFHSWLLGSFLFCIIVTFFFPLGNMWEKLWGLEMISFWSLEFQNVSS